MIVVFLIILFVITFLSGLLPIFIKINEYWSNLLLAFSGATLLGITFLHLLPETFASMGFKGGVFVLIGFFLQLFLQKFSHGLEHGHTHHHSSALQFMPIYIGLSVHAFLEGIPLGYNFQQTGTISGLVLGVAAHKVPEAITLMSVVATLPYAKKQKSFIIVHICFIDAFSWYNGLYNWCTNYYINLYRAGCIWRIYTYCYNDIL